MAKKSKAKQNTIKFNELKSAAIPNMPENETTVKWHGLDLIIKRYLTIEEVDEFVMGVVANAFDVSDQEDAKSASMSYMPEFLDYLVELQTVRIYTNIDSSSLATERHTTEMYDIIKRTDILDVVRDNIDLYQYRQVIDGAKDKLDFYLHILQKDVEQELDDMAESLSKVVDVLEAVFGDMTSDDLVNLSKILTSSDALDKDQLVKIALNSDDKKRL